MKQTILAIEKAAMERWRNGDPRGFVENSAEDIIYIDPGLTSPIVGLEKYKEYMAQIEGKVHYQGSEFINPKVVNTGDAAVLTYNYCSSSLTAEGTITSQTHWNCTEVYFHRAGNWKIVHSHWSFIKQKLPPQIEIPVAIHSIQKEYEGVLGEILAIETKAMHRWRKGDPGGFLDISDREVTYFDTGTPQRIDGREDLSAEYKLREGKIIYDVMDFIDPKVQVRGDMAVLTYRFLSTWCKPDGSVSRRTPWNCTEVFARKEANWKIIHTHWSFIKGVRE